MRQQMQKIARTIAKANSNRRNGFADVCILTGDFSGVDMQATANANGFYWAKVYFSHSVMFLEAESIKSGAILAFYCGDLRHIKSSKMAADVCSYNGKVVKRGK